MPFKLIGVQRTVDMGTQKDISIGGEGKWIDNDPADEEEIGPFTYSDDDTPDDDDQVIEQVDPGSEGQEAALGEGRDREVQQRAAAARALPRPVIPTKAEREEHELTHVTCAMVSTLRKSQSDE